MIDSTLSVPFWAVAVFLFLGGVVVGKLLFEPRRGCSRPPIPNWVPEHSSGFTPDAKNHIKNPAPPPKAL